MSNQERTKNKYYSYSVDDTRKIAEQIANSILNYYTKNKSNFIINLRGELGVGKTLFSNYLINNIRKNRLKNNEAMNIKSPTYTIIESYDFDGLNVYHLDLYRLADPDEFNYLGIDELFKKNDSLFIIEWPEKASSFLPGSDMDIKLGYINKDGIFQENTRVVSIVQKHKN